MFTSLPVKQEDLHSYQKLHIWSKIRKHAQKMPSGARRLSRAGRGSTGGCSDLSGAKLGCGAPVTPPIEPPALPKHFPFPNTPVDNDVFFDFLMTVFSICATGLQFLQLYRSVWWLPQSYTNNTMNYYLIDIHLPVFIIMIFLRRLYFHGGCWMVSKLLPFKTDDEVNSFSRYILSLFFGVVLTTLAVIIIGNQPKVNILYLCYPVLVYLILFGYRLRPIFETVTWCSDGTPPLHACSSNAHDIRREVDNLRANFNDRLRQILFSAVVNAYYAGFIPCCFAQPQLQYDVYWAAQHVFFIFLSSFVFSVTHLLPLRYCDVLHRSALHLGTWEKIETGRTLILVNNDWRDDCLWPSGVLVKYEKSIWRAQGDCNSSRPGEKSLNKFYRMFIMPSRLLSLLLLLHTTMIFYQLFLLVRVVHWYKIFSLALMLFFNYYPLYKICRDFLVSYKIYKMINDTTP